MPEPGAPLPGDLDTDVAIVGAGYTGLWTAYYLKRARPDLQVDVLEARFAGFGASGRDGGWLAALDRALRRWPSERNELLDARQLAERVRVSGGLGAVFLPQCARLNLAKLVRGLADVVRGLGCGSTSGRGPWR